MALDGPARALMATRWRLFIDNRMEAAYEPAAHTPWRKPLNAEGWPSG